MLCLVRRQATSSYAAVGLTHSSHKRKHGDRKATQMQMKFDLTDTEIVNLKRKIDELDPVAQSEVIVKYLGKNYTQKQLGAKLGKTRDWVAKRVQFIKSLEKLPEAEQKKVKNLVRHHTISLDVVILIADLPKEQRWEILSKRPTVAEARRLIYEYRQSQSSEAKLRVLEGRLSKAYIELEKMFSRVLLWSVATIHGWCHRSISPLLSIKVEEFINEIWDNNYRFGVGVQVNVDREMDVEMLRQRINWLELPESKRIEILQKAIADCQILSYDMVKELESQARQLPSLRNMVNELQLQLALFKLGNYQNVEGVSLNFGNGIPPLVLNIAGDQFKMLYRALAGAFHPDKHPKDKQQYDAIMKNINVWNDDVLKKNVKRKSI